MKHPSEYGPTGDTLPPTERRLPASEGLDELSTIEILTLLNEHDSAAADAVRQALPQLASIVEDAAARFRRGATIHYFGAGTSGRLGVLDAAELVPTFSLESGRVVAHLAGGTAALTEAVEGAEDSQTDGEEEAAHVGPDDLVIGIAASGNTPYVAGALTKARELGAGTVLISNNPDARLADLADTHILLDTGAEVLTGSTRLKAASAEKMALNGFSTALMIAVGRIWSNLMVSVRATNEKLRERTVRILQEATGLPAVEARHCLDRCDGDLKVAILTTLGEVQPTRARELLVANADSVRAALANAR